MQDDYNRLDDLRVVDADVFSKYYFALKIPSQNVIRCELFAWICIALEAIC